MIRLVDLRHSIFGTVVVDVPWTRVKRKRPYKWFFRFTFDIYSIIESSSTQNKVTRIEEEGALASPNRSPAWLSTRLWRMCYAQKRHASPTWVSLVSFRRRKQDVGKEGVLASWNKPSEKVKFCGSANQVIVAPIHLFGIHTNSSTSLTNLDAKLQALDLLHCSFGIVLSSLNL